MKLIRIPTAFLCCLLLINLCFLSSYAQETNTAKSTLDMIPYDSLAYISLSKLDDAFDTVMSSPEWEEFSNIEYVKPELEKAKQPLSFLPMLLGITNEEFLKSFGHNMVVILMGMDGEKPVAGLIADVRTYGERVHYAVDQAATIPSAGGKAMLEEKNYRDVPYTSLKSQQIEAGYCLLDNYLIVGINGGFEKLIDQYKDGEKSIKDSSNFQLMQEKVSMSGEICVYADLERAQPIIEYLMNKDTEKNKVEKAMDETVFKSLNTTKETILKSMKSFALNLSLSGHIHEIYLNMKSDKPNPITDFLLASHSAMSTADLIPFNEGALLGFHIGALEELLDKGLEAIRYIGEDTKKMDEGIKNIETALKLDLRKDLLSTLTGEFAVMAMLPKEKVDIKKNKLQIAKLRPVIFVGVKDRERLEKTVAKLMEMTNLKTFLLREQSYDGHRIYTKVVPLEILVPGVAIVPSYTFKDDLMIASNNTEWVIDVLDMYKQSSARDDAWISQMQEKIVGSRLLFHSDDGGIAEFLVSQDLIGDVKLTEEAKGKAGSLGSSAVSVSLGPDGVGVRLISASEENWITKIMRGVLLGVYANPPHKDEASEETSVEEISF